MSTDPHPIFDARKIDPVRTRCCSELHPTLRLKSAAGRAGRMNPNSAHNSIRLHQALGPRMSTVRRAIIYANYCRGSRLAGFIPGALEEYRRHAERLIFVTTSPLGSADSAVVRRRCDLLIERPNVGFDFLSWKEGMRAVPDAGEYDEIILVNSSVIGPFAPIDEMLAALTALPADIVGLSQNWQCGRHLQSYFLVFKKPVIRSGDLTEFLDGIRQLSDKAEVVSRYEVGLTSFFESRGYRLAALYALPERTSAFFRLVLWLQNASLLEPRRSYYSARHLKDEVQTNPVHYCWRAILESGIPYVKKELLRSNPLFVRTKAIAPYLRRRYRISQATLLSDALS